MPNGRKFKNFRRGFATVLTEVQPIIFFVSFFFQLENELTWFLIKILIKMFCFLWISMMTNFFFFLCRNDWAKPLVVTNLHFWDNWWPAIEEPTKGREGKGRGGGESERGGDGNQNKNEI